MDELKKIYPARKDVTLTTGETISVSPIRFKNLHTFGGALIVLLEKASAMGMSLTGDISVAVVAKLFDVAYEEIVTVMAAALDKPAEWVEELDAFDGIQLLVVVLEQNLNDITKKKIEALVEMMGSRSIS